MISRPSLVAGLVILAGVLPLVAVKGFESGAPPAQSEPPAWVSRYDPVLKSDPALLDGVPGDPSVLKVGAGYVMYYGAAKGDFSDGNTVRIFRATSQDGIAWKRNSIPVLAPGPAKWDSVKVEAPSVVTLPNGTYRMYYGGSNIRDSEAGFHIGLATSRDGVKWQKYDSPVLSATKASFDDLGILGSSVLQKNGHYWMWYPGLSSKSAVAIGLARSQDGLRWEKKGVVLKLDVEKVNKSDIGVISPHVIWNGAMFEMFYVILENEGKLMGPIWHAVSSDGLQWKKDARPILERGGKKSWTANGIDGPSVLLENGKYRMWFSGNRTDGKTFFEGGIGLAEK